MVQRFLKVSQVMEILNLSRGKAYKMIKKGVLPAINLDGCIRVPEEVLDEIIRQQLKGKPQEKVEDFNVLFGGRAERRKR